MSAFRWLLFYCLLFRFDSGKEKAMNKETKSKENVTYETMGQRIRMSRIKLGYTQESLAEMMYLKKATISKYEKDQRDIPTSVLVRMADILMVTPNYLINGSNDWIDEMKQILIHIKEPELQKVAKLQMLALANICK